MCKNKFSEEQAESIREQYIGYSCLELQNQIQLVERTAPFDETLYEVLNELIHEATDNELLNPDD